MAFNVGISSKDAFKELKKMTPRARQDYARSPEAATNLSMLTPAEFAELFPNYLKKGLPDVSGFREAISKKSRQKQDDINFGLSQGAHSVEEAEQMGSWRRRLGGGKGDQESISTSSSRSGAARPASGSLAINQREAYKAARAEGLSDTAAKALVANMSGESLANPSSVNKDYNARHEFVHMARGIVQWDPPRSEAIKNHFGKYPDEMSVAEQTRAAIWEIRTSNDPRLRQTWATLNDPNATPDQMVDVLVRKYERSAFQDRDIGNRMRYYRGLNVDGNDSQGVGGETGKTTAGGSYEVTKNGFVVPKDKGLYDSGNTEQCATLGKAFNPSIGRSNSWTVVKGDIKPGMTVATMQYNNGGADRTHAGYHTGVAMTAPDKDGNFLLLEQYSGRPAQVRSVNAYRFSTGSEGGYTQFGIISSGGKLHTEQSMEALQFGASIAGGDQRAAIMANYSSVSTGGQGVGGEGTGNQPTVTAQAAQTTQAPKAAAQGPAGPPIDQSIPQDQSAQVSKPEVTASQRQQAEKKKVEQTASVGAQYTVNVAEFRKIAEKENFLAAAASNERIRTGFNDDDRVKAAGAYIDDKWVLHIKDKNNPSVKEVMSGMDTSSVLTPVKESGDKPKTGEGVGDAAPSQTTPSVRDAYEFHTGENATWHNQAPVLMRRLMRDFKLSKEQAAGVVGNMAKESKPVRGPHRGMPLTAGAEETPSKSNPKGGGVGWAQWTGARATAFRNFAEQYGKTHNIDNPVGHPEVNYQFLKSELEGTAVGPVKVKRHGKVHTEMKQYGYSSVMDKIRQQTTQEGAALVYMRDFERPKGTVRKATHIGQMRAEARKSFPERLSYANQAMAYLDASEKTDQEKRKMFAQTTPETKVETATPTSIRTAEGKQLAKASEKTMLQKGKDFLFGQPAATAQEITPKTTTPTSTSTPTTPSAAVTPQQRVNGDIPGLSAPSQDTNLMQLMDASKQNQPPAPVAPAEKPPQQINIDALSTPRPPSLDRAMDRARGFESVGGHFESPQIAR